MRYVILRRCSPGARPPALRGFSAQLNAYVQRYPYSQSSSVSDVLRNLISRIAIHKYSLQAYMPNGSHRTSFLCRWFCDFRNAGLRYCLTASESEAAPLKKIYATAHPTKVSSTGDPANSSMRVCGACSSRANQQGKPLNIHAQRLSPFNFLLQVISRIQRCRFAALLGAERISKQRL